MGLLAPPTPATPLTPRQRIDERLSYWRDHLLEHKAGNGNVCLTLPEIRKQLDRLLDQLADEHPTLRGCHLVEGETACRGCGQALDPTQPELVA